MQHSPFVERDVYPGFFEFAHVAAAGEVGEQVVRSAGGDKLDVDAFVLGDDERLHQRSVGHEVGCDDPDALFDAVDGADDRLEKGVARNVGPGGHHLDIGVAARAAGRSGDDRLGFGGVGPVRGEDLGVVVDRRALGEEEQVLPARGVGGRAHVLAGKVHAAGEHRPLVEKVDLAVVAEVDVVAKRHAQDRHEKADLRA